MRNLLTVAFVVASLTGSMVSAQSGPTLRVGDRAPSFQVGKWYKGDPISGLAKGRVYVIDFWATRCGPCVAAIPQISALAKKYRGEVTITGVSVQKWQDGSPNDTRALVKAFMNTAQGHAMNYNVAADTDSGFMVKKWLAAAGFDSIPTAFVVGKDRKIAWIGDPTELSRVLARLVSRA